MTTFLFRGKDGKIVYADFTSSLFAISDNPDNPDVPTYVYSAGRNSSQGGMEVPNGQITRARLDFVLEFLAEHGAWKVDFSDVDSIVFNNTIVVTAADLQAATATTATVTTATLGDFGLQVARPK